MKPSTRLNSARYEKTLGGGKTRDNDAPSNTWRAAKDLFSLWWSNNNEATGYQLQGYIVAAEEEKSVQRSFGRVKEPHDGVREKGMYRYTMEPAASIDPVWVVGRFHWVPVEFLAFCKPPTFVCFTRNQVRFGEAISALSMQFSRTDGFFFIAIFRAC